MALGEGDKIASGLAVNPSVRLTPDVRLKMALQAGAGREDEHVSSVTSLVEFIGHWQSRWPAGSPMATRDVEMTPQ